MAALSYLRGSFFGAALGTLGSWGCRSFWWPGFICALLSPHYFRLCWSLHKPCCSPLLWPLCLPTFLLVLCILCSPLCYWFFFFSPNWPHLPLASFFPCDGCIVACLQLHCSLCGRPFSFHLADSPPAGKEDVFALQEMLSFGWKRTGFLAVPEWRSFSAGNRQNPFIWGTSCFLQWKPCFSNMGRHTRGTWNHRINWARLPGCYLELWGKIILNFSSSLKLLPHGGRIKFTWHLKIKQEI